MRYKKSPDNRNSIYSRAENKKISEKILTGLAWGLITPAVLLSPYGLFFLARGVLKKYFRQQDFYRETRRLRKKGYIALTKSSKGWLIQLTEKGYKKQKSFLMAKLELKKDIKWDGSWRLLFFDIPETCKVGRNLLEKKLKELGMYNFQRSVFAYPFDCKEELNFICEHYGIAKYVTYLETDKIDINEELKRHFRLKT